MAYERRDFSGAPTETTITAGINASDVSISIASATGWPTGSQGKFYVVIDPGTASEEKILVQSRSGTTLTIASAADRGADDTTAASHSSGATIYCSFSAQDADEANYWVAELAGAAAAASDIIIADGDNSLSKITKGSNSTVLRVDSGGTLGYGTITSAMIADGTIATGDIADAAVDENKLAASVAGVGLTGGAGSALAVNVDASTIEIATDTVQVKDAGITLAKMANIATDRLIGRDTAGTGVPEAITVGGGIEFTGSGGIQRGALSGDVSASAGSGTTTIGAGKVTNAMLAGSIATTKLDTTEALTSYTPTLKQAGSTLTKTVEYAKYIRFGPIVQVWAQLSATATGTAGGEIKISLPVNHAFGATGITAGGARLFRSGGGGFDYLGMAVGDNLDAAYATLTFSSLVTVPQILSGDKVIFIFQYAVV